MIQKIESSLYQRFVKMTIFVTNGREKRGYANFGSLYREVDYIVGSCYHQRTIIRKMASFFGVTFEGMPLETLISTTHPRHAAIANVVQ